MTVRSAERRGNQEILFLPRAAWRFASLSVGAARADGRRIGFGRFGSRLRGAPVAQRCPAPRWVGRSVRCGVTALTAVAVISAPPTGFEPATYGIEVRCSIRAELRRPVELTRPRGDAGRDWRASNVPAGTPNPVSGLGRRASKMWPPHGGRSSVWQSAGLWSRMSGVQVPSVTPNRAASASRPSPGRIACGAARASSSTRQSNGLLIRRFWVQLPGGAPRVAAVHHTRTRASTSLALDQAEKGFVGDPTDDFAANRPTGHG